MCTINAAKLALKEDQMGSIEKGKYADLVVLKEDPFCVSHDRIKDIEVMMTLVDGIVRYDKGGILSKPARS